MNKNELYQSEINLIENIKKYINYRNNVQNILFHQEYIKVTLYIPLVFTILFATFFIWLLTFTHHQALSMYLLLDLLLL
ncbi:hypothetical protein EN12_22850 [Vibrio cholerae]|nr:hypothetical protein EN12_22850 [Vibrio cholerae]